MKSKAEQFDVAGFFLALSDRTRLRLLNLMGDDELCVCFFVEVLGEPQPKISRHLAYLRQAGVVSARREGKWMHYRVVEPPDPRAAHVFNEVRAWLREDEELKRDREQLVKVCCAPRMPVQLLGAPKPASLAALSAKS